jgi:hypothetical protein
MLLYKVESHLGHLRFDAPVKLLEVTRSDDGSYFF